jgi:hypothetical protein
MKRREGGGRNEPPGDQTWIRNEVVIRAFFISKSTVAHKEEGGRLFKCAYEQTRP